MADALGRLGWASACVSPVVKLSGRQRIIRRYRPDLLVFQQCRHPLNDGHIDYGIPFVLDTDDADFYLSIPGLAERLDRTSRGAVGIMTGSRFLQAWHSQRNANTIIIWTGTPISEKIRPLHLDRQHGGFPILCWAQAQPLDYGLELKVVLKLVDELVRRKVPFTLRFYGVGTDEQAGTLRGQVPQSVPLELMPPMAYEDFLSSLCEVAVGLSPIVVASEFSRGKSFGKILGYLDANVPVIASDEADHALFFDGQNGLASNDMQQWIEMATKWLLDPATRQSVADNAFTDLQKKLSVDVAAARTDAFLRRCLIN